MLRFKRVLDVLVELLVAACGFCCVQVAAANDVAVSGGKVERISDGFELVQRNELSSSQRNVNCRGAHGLATYLHLAGVDESRCDVFAIVVCRVAGAWKVRVLVVELIALVQTVLLFE